MKLPLFIIAFLTSFTVFSKEIRHFNLIIKFNENIYIDNSTLTYKVNNRPLFIVDKYYQTAKKNILITQGLKGNPLSSKSINIILRTLQIYETCISDSNTGCSNADTNTSISNLIDSMTIQERYLSCGNMEELLNYFSLCSCSFECLEQVARVLNELEEVEVAYIETISLSPTSTSLSPTSTVVTPRPTQLPSYTVATNYWEIMNIQPLWSVDGGLGENAKIFVIEADDVPQAHCKYDISRSGIGTHSTHVYGILKAKHQDCNNCTNTSCTNCSNIKGIIPNATVQSLSGNLCSQEQNGSVDIYNTLYNKILYAILSSKAGDVLLLEFGVDRTFGRKTVTNMPPEASDPIKQIIKYAVCRGITVVEPAGNGNNRYNTRGTSYGGIFSDDSGGIIVGATRIPYQDNNILKTQIIRGTNTTITDCADYPTTTNYGSRIDTYALGENILTTKGTNDCCKFGLTSGASAIVAGMVASIQSVCKKRMNNENGYISPYTIRNWLRQGGYIDVVGSSNGFADGNGLLLNLSNVLD